ncbi:MAG: hypothetical protein HY794_13245 [Desulfarculus sp.]|nr:hypothetical protein [Desulfarculus sp.]
MSDGPPWEDEIIFESDPLLDKLLDRFTVIRPSVSNAREVKGLMTVLDKIGNHEKHDHFIQEILRYIHIFKRDLNYPSQGELYRENKANLERLKRARNTLRQYSSGKMKPYIMGDARLENLYDDSDEYIGQGGEHYLEIQNMASMAIRHLDRLIYLLDELPIKGQTGQSDKHKRITDFVNTVARLMADHIATPTSTNNGPFWQIICICFESAGLATVDPRRHIERAVRLIRH